MQTGRFVAFCCTVQMLQRHRLKTGRCQFVRRPNLRDYLSSPGVTHLQPQVTASGCKNRFLSSSIKLRVGTVSFAALAFDALNEISQVSDLSLKRAAV